MFIETQDTPNPLTLKFLPGRPVLQGGLPSIDLQRDGDYQNVALAEMLFSIPNVERVFFGDDFIAVTRHPRTDWPHLKPAVLGAIMDYFVAGGDVVSAPDATADAHTVSHEYKGEAAEIVEQIKELLDTRVRPAVAQDGGDIVFKHFDTDSGTVFLSMRGACAGCPSSTMTLKSGIENLLKHYVPEITAVEQAV